MQHTVWNQQLNHSVVNWAYTELQHWEVVPVQRSKVPVCTEAKNNNRKCDEIKLKYRSTTWNNELRDNKTVKTERTTGTVDEMKEYAIQRYSYKEFLKSVEREIQTMRKVR